MNTWNYGTFESEFIESTLRNFHSQIEGLNGGLTSALRGDYHLGPIVLKDACYCPKSPVNLISVSKLDMDAIPSSQTRQPTN
ncbi:unnamed protein product [Ambrosiozyma monospora]|uniref:Unnamed protein product n=1 Tax=Ambrosiozyma monospora TaxID=43982 RepID=A0ACB5TTC0_AMBMO|nr:unnamed protein product [Ambrosiozyma monospora]